MNTETVPTASVRPLDRNPRRHPEKQIAELVRSLKAFGQYRPLVVDEEGVILAGNGLHAAIVRAELPEVTIYRMTGLSDDEKKKLVLADNRTGDLSNDDFDVVEQMLAELSDFHIPGYDHDMLASLMADADDLVTEAAAYGTLDPAVRDRMLGREEAAAEAQEAATVGAPPPAPRSIGEEFDEVPSVAAGADGPTQAADGSAPACECCGRPW